MDLRAIKLIIWDMDETFWDGTLSEGGISLISQNVEFVKDLTNCGIINSICSKNEFNSVKKVLSQAGVWEYFVFPKISWEPKGKIVRQTIQDMNLRAENTLFIDDNPSNREEVAFYCPGISVCGPEEIDTLIRQCRGLQRKDLEHHRLQQYRILERKCQERSEAISNDEFLLQSNVCVTIYNDCLAKIDRIHELIMRTNQLNYTKKRISKEELKELLSDDAFSCGYVVVTDRYGDYGVCGFYAQKRDYLEHFLFSCRAMGMGVEQFLYVVLGRPKLEVVGDVTYTVSDAEKPVWINQEKCQTSRIEYNSSNRRARILMKGPCDVEQILAYIKGSEQIDCELTYINPDTGVSIESYNHTEQIVEALMVPHQRQQEIINEIPFASQDFFSDKIYADKYDAVFLSLFTDPALALYQRKETGEKIAFGQVCYDLTDRNNWPLYMNGSIFNANCDFTYAQLETFASQYRYIGRLQPEEVLNNLIFIRKHMHSSTLLVLFLGVEFAYPSNTECNSLDRHVYHQQLNALVRKWAQTESGVTILDYGEIVKTPGDMYNNINHFKKNVYYQMTQKVLDVINQLDLESQLQQKTQFNMIRDSFYQYVYGNPDALFVRVGVQIKEFLRRIGKIFSEK